MWWPGAVYDGKKAKQKYTEQILATAKRLLMDVEIEHEPFHSIDEAKQWITQVEEKKVDGLLLVVLDRQEHSWPTALKVAQSKIPSIIFSPLGTSQTPNTTQFADIPGCVVYSTDDFSQVEYGMKMLSAAAKMNRTRCVVIQGTKRYDRKLPDLGITLHYVPAATFVDLYKSTPDSDKIIALADEYIRLAKRRKGSTREDVINGVKSYYVAGKILETEQADAITMDCLGTLANINVSLPCIAWSRMNDDGIPAACEADHGAVAAHIIVQYLFDRPGFEQDPVADTADDSIIGSHCSCPTRLNGFDKPPEPFELVHHHGNRDAVPRTIWKKGQRVTCLDVLPVYEQSSSEEDRSKVLVSAGTVIDNINVPPSGGCVVAVKVKFDGTQNVLNYPGFHQLFFYGDYVEQVKDFCKLCNLQVQVV
jgi:L-fucose isomerase-like protein